MKASLEHSTYETEFVDDSSTLWLARQTLGFGASQGDDLESWYVEFTAAGSGERFEGYAPGLGRASTEHLRTALAEARRLKCE